MKLFGASGAARTRPVRAAPASARRGTGAGEQRQERGQREGGREGALENGHGDQKRTDRFKVTV